MSKQYTQEDYDNAAVWWHAFEHSKEPTEIRVVAAEDNVIREIYKCSDGKFRSQLYIRGFRPEWNGNWFPTKHEAYMFIIDAQKRVIERMKSELAKAEADLEVLLVIAAQEGEK